MSLFDVTEFPKGESTYRKPAYFKNVIGDHYVRVLPQQYTKKWAHYYMGTYVTCIKDDDVSCPICDRNVKIRAEFPNDFRNGKGYCGLNQRFCVNILDRTNVIICPKCNEENIAGVSGKFNPACSSCGTILTGQRPAPLDKVKLLSGGPELFNILNGFNESILDDDDEPLGLANFDVKIMCMKVSDRIKPIPVPEPTRNDVLEVDEAELFDTEASVPVLSALEIGELARGVKMRDIYLARGRNSKPTTKVEGDDEELSDAEDLVNQLFNS